MSSKIKNKEISGWGLYPKIKAKKCKPNSISELKEAILNRPSIARGNGRSYGDSAINKSNTIDMTNFNRFLNFNDETGLLVAQSGVILNDVINIFLPKKWFPVVTPGTKYVTIGGMVASDVHGKNHHKNGSFANYIEWLDIMNNNGEIIRCSKKENKNLFFWTLGGMGLTGIIINVAFFLKPIETSWIKQKLYVTKNIAQTFEFFEKNINSTYSVAWIDCYSRNNNLGRSLLTLGEHANEEDLKSCFNLEPFKYQKKTKISIPFFFPPFILNNLSVKIFNSIYFFSGKLSKKNKIVDWDSFFYPLDKILNWNKIYGYKGFIQFQCVIPLLYSKKGISELLKCISNSKSSSFLAVLKRFGKQNSNFSFPMEGYSLALDFPINKKNLSLIEVLDKITIRNGGRFYLAKDSRVKRKIFEISDNRIKQFRDFRKEFREIYTSLQSERLGL